MKTLDYLIPLVRKGDKLELEPLDTLPNFPRTIVVDYKTDDGFVYDSSETDDGKVYPYWAIKSLKIR